MASSFAAGNQPRLHQGADESIEDQEEDAASSNYSARKNNVIR